MYSLYYDDDCHIPFEILVYNIVNFIPSLIFYSFHIDWFSYTLINESFHLGQMTGYPYLDFDLGEIFNLMPFNLVLEIYFLNF